MNCLLFTIGRLSYISRCDLTIGGIKVIHQIVMDNLPLISLHLMQRNGYWSLVMIRIS